MVIGVRDPLGVRPLVLGKLGDGWILASETCALDIIGADYRARRRGGRADRPRPARRHLDEAVRRRSRSASASSSTSISRGPTASWKAHSVYDARKRIGAELAREAPVAADVVIPVPDSGVPAALGYAAASGIPFELGIIRNHYVGRTFIEPTDQIRHLGVRLKHNANRAHVNGKRVVLVDDSIVRGTTSKKIVEMMRNAGATEVHMRISSPADRAFLLLRHRHAGAEEPARRQLRHRGDGATSSASTSLAFISIDGLYRAMGLTGRDNTPAAILRRLLHRRLSDRPHRPGRRHGLDPAVAAGPAGMSEATGAPNTQALAGRICLVTGASRGIGRAIATRYAREGADLILTARTVGALEELDDEIRAINGKTSLLVPMDLRNFDTIDQLGAGLYERYGKVDVLVGNAGVLGTMTPLAHLEPQGLAGGDRRQPDRQLAPDPQHRSAAAPVGRRPRHLRLQRRRPRRARLLGRLCRVQGRARDAGRHLCQGNPAEQRARQHHRPRPHPHPHARRRLSRRGPDDPAHAGGDHGAVRAPGARRTTPATATW